MSQPKFICIKEIGVGTNLLLNLSHIVSIKETESGHEVALSNGDTIRVKKNFSELMNLLDIENAALTQ
jgi:hypothetical protein